MTDNRLEDLVYNDALANFLHDMKQPLNLIRVIAQDVRLDIKKGRLELGGLPDSMAEIEETIDHLISAIEEYRQRAGH